MILPVTLYASTCIFWLARFCLLHKDTCIYTMHMHLSVCRMLEDVPDHSDPSLNLSANLPSLKFHIDEHKVSPS